MRYIPTYNTNIDEQIARNREIIMNLPPSILPGVDEVEDSRANSYLQYVYLSPNELV